MSSDGASVALLLLMLMLPLSALLARRIPLTTTAKMALAWAAIFAVGLVIAGQRERLRPLYDGAVSTLTGDGQQVSGDTVRIAMAPDGHFWATATIDGVARRMLVDSGATETSLSEATARAAGLDTAGDRFGAMIETANGPVVASRARVREFRLGGVVARDLAVLVAPNFGDTDVIGMNFLSRLKSWRVEGRTLVLEPHKANRRFT